MHPHNLRTTLMNRCCTNLTVNAININVSYCAVYWFLILRLPYYCRVPLFLFIYCQLQSCSSQPRVFFLHPMKYIHSYLIEPPPIRTARSKLGLASVNPKAVILALAFTKSPASKESPAAWATAVFA